MSNLIKGFKVITAVCCLVGSGSFLEAGAAGQAGAGVGGRGVGSGVGVGTVPEAEEKKNNASKENRVKDNKEEQALQDKQTLDKVKE